MSKSKWTHSGNWIIGGFVILILLMSWLIIKTLNQNFSMVTKNYYEQEAVYQDKLDATKRAKDFDSLFSIKKDAQKLELQIPNQLAASLDSGVVWFYCQSEENNDKKMAIQKNPTGIYNFNTQGWKSANYTAKISFDAGGKSYYKELFFTL